MFAASFAPSRFTFALKLAAAGALVALADHLFYGQEPGWTLGLFALAWAVALRAAVPALRRDRAARIAIAAAAGFALVLIDDPNPLAWSLFWVAASLAALLPRAAFDDALSWMARVAIHAVTGPFTPLRDTIRTARLGRRRGGPNFGGTLSLLALPLIGGAIFLTLFAVANPVIGQALSAMRLPDLGDAIPHLIFWLVVLTAVWPSLRPTRLASGVRFDLVQPIAAPDPPARTLILSLVVFNAVFALQNALDLAYLWSGAALPEGVTIVEYARRGAHTLVVTALLAGLFVLIALRPHGEGASRPIVRRLVALWTVQNMLLLASSVLRTLDYIDAYSLTRLKIAALLWMALVATGLALICWRMLQGRSAAWLINANAFAAALVLAICAMVDLGSVASAWNVRHAREIDGTGAALDLCYLSRQGSSALVSLAELERGLPESEFADRIASVRAQIMRRVEAQQADWRSWTWRDARRLAVARELLGPSPMRPRPAPRGRSCHGFPLPPPPPAVAPAPPPPPRPPLTNGAQR